MQPGGLFEVNEATNVFFMIFRDCFISENAINLSSVSSQNPDSMFILACEQALYFRLQENVSQSKH